ncbi:MAG TPA: PKD domain-containing protein [Puia sp.]|nr:PKD domain-containing protein [Puia sp.]
MKIDHYPLPKSLFFLRFFTVKPVLFLIILLSAEPISAQLNFGNNPGYYGNHYTDQQLYDLMWKGGARSTRSFLDIQAYSQYGVSAYHDRLLYPYSIGMRNNVLNLAAEVSSGNYTGRDTSHVGGYQTWLPKGLYLDPFNADGTINTNNIWAKYCADVVQSIGSGFDYYEVWNEPDITNTADCYLDSNQSKTSWQKVPPDPATLYNLYAPNGVKDYVQLCKITSQVIKHYKPTAKICTGGVGYSWFYMWFLRYGGGQWIDEISIHLYPYFNWTTWPNNDNRNSDYAVKLIDSSTNAQRAAETITGSTHLPIMITEVNVPGWSYTGTCDAFPCNKVWGNAQVQRNFGIKAITKMLSHGFTNFYLFALGNAVDSGNISGNEFNSMGWYNNLNTATPGSEVMTQQGIGCRTLQNKAGNYTIESSQPQFPSGVDGVRFDSSGYKIYLVWAKTTGKGDNNNTASYAVPSGTFIKYAWDGTNNGIASGTITLTGDPVYLVQISSSATAVTANAGNNQTITLPLDSVNLNGSSSSVINSTITSYLWTQVSGPSSANLTSSTNVTTTANNLVAGTYVFSLQVADANKDSSTATVTVTVNPQNLPPVVSAGTAQTITLPVSSVTLTGTATDATGTISSYQWTEVSGPNTATFSNATSVSTTVSGLVAGTYVFQLKATDNGGLSGTGTVTIIVNAAPNQPPVANAGSNQTITLPTKTVSVDGSASKDPDGVIVSFNWSQISGPSQASITSSSSISTTITNLIQGTYVFLLTVTDNNGATGKDSISIVVNPAPNQPPVANAGTSTTITLPANSTSLDGTKSYDPDGSIVSYNWTELSGPSSATISGALTATPTVSNLVAGKYIFQLTVTDNSGASSSAQVNVTVNSSTNTNPVANAGANQNITLPVNSVSVDGSASIAPPSSSIVSFAWLEVSGPSSATIANPTNVSTSINNLIQGTYIFQLTVTDNNGNKGVDSMSVTVNAAANKPPIANAGTAKTITLPVNSVTLDGTKSYDLDGTIVSYNWAQLSGPSTATITGSSTATATAAGLVAGQYILQLTVTDNNGSSSSAQVKITVLAALNQPPVANAGSNQTVTLPVNTVTLDGSNSYDPDGTIASYNWIKASGTGAVTITNSNTAKPTVSGLQTGSYVFQLTVTDNSGASANAQVTVTVNAAIINPPPVANAGNDTTIALPSNSATLNGSASTAPSGNIVSYQWVQVSGPGTAVVSSPGSAITDVNTLIAGVYLFELTITDNLGATAKDTVQITVVDNERLAPKQSLLLYPNPTSNTLNMQITGDTTGDLKVVIYDIRGNISMVQEYSKTASFFSTPIDVSRLFGGTYLLQATINNKTVMTGKFIKQ